MSELPLTTLCRILTDKGFPARVEGEDRLVRAVNTIEEAGQGEITFLSNPKYESALAACRASAVIVREGVVVPPRLSALRCTDPYAGVTVAIIVLHGHREHPAWDGAGRTNIHPTAKVGPGCRIAAGVTIDAESELGEGCVLYPGCFVGRGAKLGPGCVLFPNVVVYDHSVLGARVTVHACSVIGQDGLGYAPVDKKWMKIPQIGRVIIGDDVEIGANCSIDRGTLGQTVIGRGTKFGNAIVIGHGTKIGEDCLFVGQVGIAGSVTVGNRVTLAGQVGVAGHLEIGDDVQVGAQAGISGSVPAGSKLLGTPAIPLHDARRTMVSGARVPDLLKRVKELEREIERLRKAIETQRE